MYVYPCDTPANFHWFKYRSTGGVSSSVFKNDGCTSQCTSKYHGVCFIVKSELNPVFHKLSDRVIKCDITLQEEKRSRKITIINIYAPHSQITKKDIKQTEDIYNILSDQLKRNTRSTFIAGYFNAVIADGH